MKLQLLKSIRADLLDPRAPSVIFRGYDLYVVSRWLEEVLQPLIHIHADFATPLWSLNASVNLLYTSGWLLDETTGLRVKHLGAILMWTFENLLQSILNQDLMLYLIWLQAEAPPSTSHIHIFRNRRTVNPAKHATWIDEDFLAHVAKTLKLVNSGPARLRCRPRWLLGIPVRLHKFLRMEFEILNSHNRRK